MGNNLNIKMNKSPAQENLREEESSVSVRDFTSKESETTEQSERDF